MRTGKDPDSSNPNSSNIDIPLEILKDRTLSPMEAVVEYLKEQCRYSYHGIGILLNRDERNIWTIYQRAKKKRQHEKKEAEEEAEKEAEEKSAKQEGI